MDKHFIHFVNWTFITFPPASKFALEQAANPDKHGRSEGDLLLSDQTADTKKEPFKITPRELDQSPAIQEFLLSCKRATAQTYRGYLGKFFNTIAMDPSTVLALSDKEVNSLMVQYAITLKKTAKIDVEHYKQGEVSVNSVRYYLVCAKEFLAYHDKVINWKKVRRFIPEKVRRHFHVYSLQEVKQLLEFADFRERAIILLLESSGMRAGGLLGLQIRDFDVLQGNIARLTVYARTNDYYYTFCTPEATGAVQFYLKWREDVVGEVLRPSTPLIRDSPRANRNPLVARPITPRRLYGIMVNLITKAGIPRVNLQPNHSFRKLANTYFANNKVDSLLKELMMGHSVKFDDIYYDNENPESLKALLEEYKKAADALTINDENRLRKKVEELERSAPTLQSMHKEIADLKLSLEFTRHLDPRGVMINAPVGHLEAAKESHL